MNNTVIQVDHAGNARVITLLSVKVQAAWPFYTLTDADRAAHWDGTVNNAGTKGGRIPLCSPALTGKPESVRGTVRKLFASNLPCLVPGLYIVQPGKEAEAQALIQQAEAIVAQADADMASQWSQEFPDWWNNANDLARHGCQARGFDKPQPYWVRLKAHLFTAEGLSEAESEALAKDAAESVGRQERTHRHSVQGSQLHPQQGRQSGGGCACRTQREEGRRPRPAGNGEHAWGAPPCPHPRGVDGSDAGVRTPLPDTGTV